jgi:CheY-like chemotaxis protein
VSAPAYRLTDAGRRAWQSKDRAVPSDYRTILWIMDFHGPGHLPALLRMFPGQLISECLKEMEELKLVEAVGERDSSGLGAEAPSPVEYSVAESDLAAAKEALSNHGAYLSADRLKGAKPIRKPVSETTVLIVEDDPDQLALADLRVSMAGYSVRVAGSQAALLTSMAADGIPDLILLDGMLPDGDGFDILGKLRRLPSFARLPIVLLTAKAEPQDILRGLMLGADGYITKPYSKTIVAEVVQRVLHPG